MILVRVDHFLRMLHTHADGKCFWLHRNFAVGKHLKRIARTVADRKYEKVCRNLLSASFGCYRNRMQLLVSERKIGQTCLKIKGTAQTDNMIPQICNNIDKLIRSNMRLINI